MLCGRAGGQHGVRVPDHRVAAVREPGGSGVVGLAREVDPPPAVRPEPGADRQRVAGVDQRPALLDVQFDESPDPAKGLRIAPEVGGVPTGGQQRLRHAHPGRVGQPAGPVRIQLPGDDPGACAGHAEPGSLLVGEVDHADRPGRHEVVAAQHIDGREGTDHAEWPVEGAAVGHRIQVGPDGDTRPAGRHRRVRITPPRPLVPGAVRCQVQAATLAFTGEPFPHVAVLAGPGEPPVPTRRAVPPDRRDRRPHLVEGHDVPWLVELGRRCPVPDLSSPSSGSGRRVRRRRCRPARTRRRRAG